MKLTNKFLAIAALLAIFAPAAANAAEFHNKYEGPAEYEKSVVLDTNGNVVTTATGTCITHNYPASGTGECGSLADAPNIVYFDFAKSSLNAKGKAVVKQLADKINTIGASKVKLSGHADRVSSDDFNQKLSEKRVETVKQALIKKGVSESIISTEAFGESRNAVPTKDGVSEQLNRRVEVEVSR